MSTTRPPDPLLDRVRARAAKDLALPKEPSGISDAGSRYRLGEKIGEGAMSVVFEARDLTLDRVVAFKQPKDHTLISPESRERFLREARAAAKVAHPHIVAVYDVGEEGGRPYLAMERVDGEPLSAVLLRRGIDRDRLLELIEKVARALHELHLQGIVHRDLKPGNILVTRAGEPKVADFGLAHWIGSEVALTKSGSPVGTPMYMAPEQVRGRSKEISVRTDVYALGAILYEGMTGRPAFTGDHLTEVFVKILEAPPLPPSRVDRRVPADLETVILKALEKAPDDRYATALELADELGRLRRGEPILAKAPGLFYRTRRWLGRHKGPAIAATVVFLLLTGWGVTAMKSGAKETALAHFQRGETALQNGRLEEAMEAYGRALEQDPTLARAGLARGIVLERLGRPKEAERDYGLAIAANPDLALARFSRARVRVYTLSDPEGALVDAREAVRLAPEQAAHWIIQGVARQAGGDREGALEDYAEAIRRDSRSAIAHGNRALVFVELGKPLKAIEEATRAIEIDPNCVDAYLYRGHAQRQRRRRDEAIQDYESALSLAPPGWPSRALTEKLLEELRKVK